MRSHLERYEFLFLFFLSFFKSWIQENTCMTSGLEWFGFSWTAWSGLRSKLDFLKIKSGVCYCLICITSSTPLPTSPNKSLFLKGLKHWFNNSDINWYFLCFLLNILSHCFYVCIVNHSLWPQVPLPGDSAI